MTACNSSRVPNILVFPLNGSVTNFHVAYLPFSISSVYSGQVGVSWANVATLKRANFFLSVASVRSQPPLQFFQTTKIRILFRTVLRAAERHKMSNASTGSDDGDN